MILSVVSNLPQGLLCGLNNVITIMIVILFNSMHFVEKLIIVLVIFIQ